jgi:hypothetical protein
VKTFKANIIPKKIPKTKVIRDNFISKVLKTKCYGLNLISTKRLHGEKHLRGRVRSTRDTVEEQWERNASTAKD